MFRLGGIRVIVDDKLMVPFVEDWSGVRSPARAERRRRRGFPQRIKWVPSNKPAAFRVGDTIIVNSATYQKLRQELAPPKDTRNAG